MMSGGVRDVEIPVCNVDLSTRTSCVHDLVTFWASHADLAIVGNVCDAVEECLTAVSCSPRCQLQPVCG